MSQLIFNSNQGSFTRVSDRAPLEIPGLDATVFAALVMESADSRFFLPDIAAELSHPAHACLLAQAAQCQDPTLRELFKGLQHQYASLQPERRWELSKLDLVWRGDFDHGIIEQVYLTRIKLPFALLAGSKELLSEPEFQRLSFRSITEYFQGLAADATGVARTVATVLSSEIVERDVTLMTPAGIQTVRLAGPACLEPVEWLRPADTEFIAPVEATDAVSEG